MNSFATDQLKKFWLSQTNEASLDYFRRQGRGYIKEHGIPNRRDENFKYSNLKSLAEFDLDGSKGLSNSSSVYSPWFQNEITIFVNDSGFEVEIPSDYSGQLRYSTDFLKVKKAVEKLYDDSMLPSSFVTHYNSSCLENFLFLEVSENVKKLPLVHIVYDSSVNAKRFLGKIVIHALENSRFSICESFIGNSSDAKMVFSLCTDIFQAKNSQVSHFRFLDRDDSSMQLTQLRASLDTQSNLNSHLLSLGSQLSRHENIIHLNGLESQVVQNALYLPFGTSHIDCQTKVFHNHPNTQSRQFYKGLLGDDSKGVFNGIVQIKEGSRKSKAFQLNKNILLSDSAEINTKPQLEIDNDDVKCSHGATVSQLRSEELFYLQTRGICKEKAQRILAKGFCDEVCFEIPDEQLKSKWSSLIGEHLDRNI